MEDRLKEPSVVNRYHLLGYISAHKNHWRYSIVQDNQSFPQTCTGVPLICGMLSIAEWLAAHALAPLYIQL